MSESVKEFPEILFFRPLARMWTDAIRNQFFSPTDVHYLLEQITAPFNAEIFPGHMWLSEERNIILHTLLYARATTFFYRWSDNDNDAHRHATEISLTRKIDILLRNIRKFKQSQQRHTSRVAWRTRTHSALRSGARSLRRRLCR